MAARLFLFHGSDSRASSAEVRSWYRLFQEKYGDSTRYVIQADELSPADLVKEVASCVQGHSLFAAPTFVLIKRTSSKDQGVKSTAGSQLAELLSTLAPHLNSTVTVVCFEEKLLAPTHPLVAAFTALQAQGLAKVQVFSAPEERTLSSVVAKIAATYAKQLAPQSLELLRQGYRALEKRQRLASRLKVGQELREDERAWWLYQVVEVACLLAKAEVVTREEMQRAIGTIEEPVSTFEIADSLSSAAWTRARQQLELFARQSSESEYFSLLATLNWRSGRPGRVSASQMKRLLAQVELILKNFPIPAEFLMEALVGALESQREWLIEPRTLWLADLART